MGWRADRHGFVTEVVSRLRRRRCTTWASSRSLASMARHGLKRFPDWPPSHRAHSFASIHVTHVKLMWHYSISWPNPFVSHSRQSWRGVDNCCKLSINPNCNPNSLYFRAKCFVVTVTGSGFGEGKELLSFCSWEGPSFCSKQFGAPWRRWRGRKMSRRLRE